MEFGIVFWITAIVLIAAYVAVEINHGLSRRAGTVVRVSDCGLPLAGMIGCTVEVDMDNGQRVTATASGCALCQTQIGPGARVYLVKQKDNWLVSPGKGAGCNNG